MEKRLHKYILLNDRVGEHTEKDLLSLSMKNMPTQFIRGEVLVEALKDPEKIALTEICKENLRVECPISEVAKLTDSEADLLMAVNLAEERFRIYRERNRLEAGKFLNVGDKVLVKVKTLPKDARGVIWYRGTLPTHSGIMFGVELLSKDALGRGTTDGTFRSQKLFDCPKNCGMFVAMDKIRPLSERNQTFPNYSEKLRIFQKVVVFLDEKPVQGCVRYISEVAEPDGSITIGIELFEKIGRGTGMFQKKQRFVCKDGYAIFVPASTVISEEDFYGHHQQQDRLGKNNGRSCSLLKKTTILGDTSRQFESERQLHEDTRTQFESERQLHEDTRRQFESERQLHEDTRRQFERERQLHEDTRRQFESERQLHENTRKQFESERQLNEGTHGQLGSERQQHADTRGQLENEQQLHADTRGQLESEQQRHADTRAQLESEQHQHADTRGQLESNQLEHADTINEKHDLERRLEEAQHRITELESTLTTAQRALETHHNSSEATDWVLERQEIELTDKVLGIGGWANVVEGKFRGMIVAVKQIHELILSPHNRRLFEREMNIAARSRHPCLLQFIGATNDDNSPLFVTELLDTSLRNVLHERELEPNEVTTISLDVARALNYLHLNHPTPIIHRDISSANVLLWKHRDSWRAKVSDYGTANFMHYSMTISPGAVVYSAPEAQTSRQSPKVDVYSFGVLLCEMNTREFPDAMCRTEQVTMVTNHDFRDLIRRCLLEDPQERPAMNDIINELETFYFEK